MDSPHLPAKKSLGQYFLTNPRVVDTIVTATAITPESTVLEIGPGTGVLTAGLLATGARIIALEADARAITILTDRFSKEIAEGRLALHHADVRTVRLTDFVSSTPYTIAANIPYYLTGQLLRMALTSTPQPERIVFLIQKEVAERIARSTKESLLSLSVKAYGTPRHVATVSRGNFSPQPNVDSAVLAIDNISRRRFTSLDESFFFTVLKAGFSARRKQLLGNLTGLSSRNELTAHFNALDIPHDVRGEDLSIDTWCALATLLESTPATPI